MNAAARDACGCGEVGGEYDDCPCFSELSVGSFPSDGCSQRALSALESDTRASLECARRDALALIECCRAEASGCTYGTVDQCRLRLWGDQFSGPCDADRAALATALASCEPADQSCFSLGAAGPGAGTEECRAECAESSANCSSSDQGFACQCTSGANTGATFSAPDCEAQTLGRLMRSSCQ